MSILNPSSSESPAPKKIAIVDDHSIMRAVYRSLIDDSPEMTLAWTAETTQEARLHLERDDVPDAIIMDVTLPDGTGYDLVREVVKKHPRLPILMVSAHEEESYSHAAQEAGARGYMVKDSSPTDLMDALEAVIEGERHFKPHTKTDIRWHEFARH